jgi:hypothetical protein
MNWLKKGPDLKDLKLSDLHVPNFLSDLYYDLKERHLLPLVVLLLVAMVAAPIYFKKKTSPEDEAVATAPPITAEAGAAGNGATLTVARSQPGLRDARLRLKHARALDPFATRGSSSAGGETAGEEATAGEAEVSPPVASTSTAPVPTEAAATGGEPSVTPAYEPAAPVETYVPPSSPSSRGEEETTGGESTAKTQPQYASEAIDVRIVTVPASSADSAPKRAKPKPQVRRDLPELTMLPARATPAVTYMGVSKDGKKALLLVSSDVESIFGEGKCIVGSQSCQLLALEPQMPETFVYGPHERTYRIELLSIQRTVGAKPRRATLGTTKGRHGAQAGPAGAQDTEVGSAAVASEPAERGVE